MSKKKNNSAKLINEQSIILVEEKTPDAFFKKVATEGPLFRSAEKFKKLFIKLGEQNLKNQDRYIEFFNNNTNLALHLLEYKVGSGEAFTKVEKIDTSYKLLMLACKHKMNNAASELIKVGSIDYINELSNSGKSALTYACINKDIMLARQLLEAGARINVDSLQEQEFLAGFTKNGDTLLMLASKEGNDKLVSELMKLGFDYVNKQNESGKVALNYAEKNSEVEKLLLNGSQKLTDQAKKGNFTKVLNLLEKGAIIDENNISLIKKMQEKGRTLLITAIDQSYDNAVEELIKFGPKYINQASKSGKTALTFACTNKNGDLVLKLLGAGAKINLENEIETQFLKEFTIKGRTLLMSAIDKDDDVAAKELIKLGLKYINKESNSGKTALDFADLNKNSTIKNLIKKQLEKALNEELISEARDGNFNVVLKLADKGADINTESKSGKTALSYAIQKALTALDENDKKISKKLLKQVEDLLNKGAEIGKEHGEMLVKLLKSAKELSNKKFIGIKIEIKSQKNEYSEKALKKFKELEKKLDKKAKSKIDHSNDLDRSNSNISEEKAVIKPTHKKFTEFNNNFEEQNEVLNLASTFTHHCKNKNYLEISKMMSTMQHRNDLHKFKDCLDKAVDLFQNVDCTFRNSNILEKSTVESLNNLCYNAVQALHNHNLEMHLSGHSNSDEHHHDYNY